MDCFEKAYPKASRTKSSAAPLDLFVVDEDCENIRKEKFETLHKPVENMLLSTKIARQDTGTEISYLTTRVIEPDKRNWLKMVHLLKYARDNKDLPLILNTENSGMLKW